MNFQLPANDQDLVNQVYNHIDDSADFDAAVTLLSMSRKHRFAGYIGSIDFLFEKLETLTEQVKDLNKELEKMKKSKKTSWFF